MAMPLDGAGSLRLEDADPAAAAHIEQQGQCKGAVAEGQPAPFIGLRVGNQQLVDPVSAFLNVDHSSSSR
ncbi:hypothetical protein D3C87_2002430 [compost metagenome]